ncbi:YlxR family protein [Deinococcus rubellus]|uniref:DUF448 domain-containing protein n=1 Tax=Deinococcus rubellus TaxID=1889240 RepID=A0ABY5YMK3_9DEIO|nr:DUF448 domain-containing protein [Deinococcus rubellus]UWX65484.1 DUF448 domain-containing protein [Deinococcus rubellus]
MPDLTPLPPLTRHVPERSCVACRKKRPQAQFVRLVRTASGWRVVGQAIKAGRGAYVCADTPGCWAEKKLRRAFGLQATSLCSELQERYELTPSFSISAAPS